MTEVITIDGFDKMIAGILNDPEFAQKAQMMHDMELYKADPGEELGLNGLPKRFDMTDEAFLDWMSRLTEV